MDFQLPTDSLDKLLTLGGCALIFWALNISVTNYEKAELLRVKALVKVQEITFIYDDYLTGVNNAIEIYNKALRNNEDPAKYKEKILDILKPIETKDKKQILQQTLLQGLEAGYTLSVYESDPRQNYGQSIPLNF
ncbi:hypothetical protein [Acinetobacter haemolyticus]|uniref:Uncharacterized protein n=1 Tax=Acinetobacter haemolyticus TaxID=29430 RepID=A0A4P7B796_ACIHA|nr:hypothetical protein [Acinetobacter haemolyticus]QBQ16506.1 hypothetical protein AHTJR_09540 [Acinetobacter haemolyticus]